MKRVLYKTHDDDDIVDDDGDDGNDIGDFIVLRIIAPF